MNQLKMYRVFKMYELLQEKQRTIQTLCRYLNVTERTIYRYFDLFRNLGFEIQKNEFNKYKLIKL
jgi:predicted DNA-binding transcriptional regulator YafY